MFTCARALLDAPDPDAASRANNHMVKPSFRSALADNMQEKGRQKGTAWAAWKVTEADVLQWIGVWYYMLAFPQPGDRRKYFTPAPFGPHHTLPQVMMAGANGEKGVRCGSRACIHASLSPLTPTRLTPSIPCATCGIPSAHTW